MPANPLHFSTIAPLHFFWAETFDITALLWSSTLVDLELLYRLLIGEPMSHGLWHSYLFVLTIYPVVLSLILFVMENRFEKTILGIYRAFRFFPDKVRYSLRTIYLSSLVGGVSHIFLDMWVHENSAYVLFPFYEGNPFWIGEWDIVIYGLVILLSILTVFLWIKRARTWKSSGRQPAPPLS